jgi:hypothetical protein
MDGKQEQLWHKRRRFGHAAGNAAVALLTVETCDSGAFLHRNAATHATGQRYSTAEPSP